jgi:hypothetical protein
MLRSSLLSIIFCGLIIPVSAIAQSSSPADAGISTHNYKHPNKAAAAKQTQPTIRVSSLSTIEKYGKIRGNDQGISTPKYASRPATLVVTRTYEKESTLINPLTSSRNYKTLPNAANRKESELANAGSTSKDTIYPNQD